MQAQSIADALEIRIGRVLMLNPFDLEREGQMKKFLLDDVNPLGGNSTHFFVCVCVGDGISAWCPLSSSRKPHGSQHQGIIESKYKNGFFLFQNADSFYDLGQIWFLPHNVLSLAASIHSQNRVEKTGNMNAVSSVVTEAIFWKKLAKTAKEQALRTQLNAPEEDLDDLGCPYLG